MLRGMTTVIVPLDGSEMAEQALPHARDLAGGDGRVVLLCAATDGEPPAPRRYLDDLRDRSGGSSEGLLILDRPPADAILLAARDRPEALICMSAHGRSAIGAAVLGSTAEAVVRGADRPVVLVGPRAVRDAARVEAANIVVAVDSASTADRIVPVAGALAARRHLHPWVVESVLPAPYPFVADAGLPAALGETEGWERAVALFADRGQAVDSKITVADDAADGIVRFTQDLPGSYVVMAAHARSGVARFALGSVTMRVVHRSPVPVLAVPA